ncbi:hypothetical protein B0H17DRAFT_345271 [Mycena rosella]|uniref:Uncharacterized protein n=1 Tax=Mycena rosella TaxID=1033263 RepID=A0AAD7G1R3_MYCRO|nr:hypothetical protein B0H17DRAFT_345271 [Mycena rosella]
MRKRPEPSATLQPPPTPGRAPLAQFLARPSKWFTRSVSAPRVVGLNGAAGDESPRASTSSVSAPRKPKISRPTDPRPILDAEGYKGVPGSRLLVLSVAPRAVLSLRTAVERSGLGVFVLYWSSGFATGAIALLAHLASSCISHFQSNPMLNSASASFGTAFASTCPVRR